MTITAAPAPSPALQGVTYKLARNGYYQVFRNGAVIGHVYLTPGEDARGWDARRAHGKAPQHFRTRNEAIRWVATTVAK